MSTYADIIAAVKARVDTVPNRGQTHAYLRWNASWDTYFDQFKTTIAGVDQIRGWVVTIDERDPIVGSMSTAAFSAEVRTYNVNVIGIMGVKDSSNTEQTFLDLVEALLNALDGRKDLGLTAVRDYSVGPSRCRLYQLRQFGSVLCHYCEIIVPVEVEVSVTYAAG